MSEYGTFTPINETDDIVWEGAGWYAPRDHGNGIRYYRVGYELGSDSPPPDSYPHLGTPTWFDQPPTA